MCVEIFCLNESFLRKMRKTEYVPINHFKRFCECNIIKMFSILKRKRTQTFNFVVYVRLNFVNGFIFSGINFTKDFI